MLVKEKTAREISDMYKAPATVRRIQQILSIPGNVECASIESQQSWHHSIKRRDSAGLEYTLEKDVNFGTILSFQTEMFQSGWYRWVCVLLARHKTDLSRIFWKTRRRVILS